MSTDKVLRCPWCQTTNLSKKLPERHGRCRKCGRDVQWGLDYVRNKQAERRKARTKAERTRLRQEERSRPEFRERQRLLKQSRRLKSVERTIDRLWEKLSLSVEERDVEGIVSGAKSLKTKVRTLQSLKRRQTIHVPAPILTTPGRTVILPPEDES